MENLANEKIGDIVSENFKTAAVFSKYGLDFCCGGQVTIEKAADRKGINKENLLQDIKQVLKEGANEQIDFNSWPADLITSYIIKTHHRFVREKTPILTAFLDKLCKVHGNSHPELHEINILFGECAAELGQHMVKEEGVLFPAIEAMEESKTNNKPYTKPPFGSIQNPINMMMHEHEGEGQRFEKIAELTNNYTAPADACSTYRVTFDMLAEFEQDLHKHIHLENNILFPKSIKMEETLV